MSIYVRGREAFCDPSKAGPGARTLMVDIAEKANGQWSCGVAGGVPGISVETESVDMVRLRVDWRHARDSRVSFAGHNAEAADELPRRDKLYALFDVCSQSPSACSLSCVLIQEWDLELCAGGRSGTLMVTASSASLSCGCWARYRPKSAGLRMMVGVQARAQSFESNKWVPQPEHARANWSVTKNLR